MNDQRRMPVATGPRSDVHPVPNFTSASAPQSDSAFPYDKVNQPGMPVWTRLGSDMGLTPPIGGDEEQSQGEIKSGGRRSTYSALRPLFYCHPFSFFCFSICSDFFAPVYLDFYVSFPTHSLQAFVTCRQRELLALRCYSLLGRR